MVATVPITVENRADRKAISRVLYSACMIAALANSSLYHFRVNPPHFARVLLALKESTIRVAMGAYMKMKISAT